MGIVDGLGTVLVGLLPAGLLLTCRAFALNPALDVSHYTHIPSAKLGNKVTTALAADPAQDGLWLGFSNGGISYWKDGQAVLSAGRRAGHHGLPGIHDAPNWREVS